MAFFMGPLSVSAVDFLARLYVNNPFSKVLS